jgi:uncharacterized protein
MTEFTSLADGRDFLVRVTPRAAQNKIEPGIKGISDLRAWVTVVPEDGKANKAVIKLMAKSLGVAKTRLELVRGANGRDKVFRVKPE